MKKYLKFLKGHLWSLFKLTACLIFLQILSGFLKGLFGHESDWGIIAAAMLMSNFYGYEVKS